MEPISAFSQILLGGIATGTVLYTFGADLLASGSRGTVRHGPDGQHAVALTFDDGPDPVFTPRILDILDEFGAHATFFIIGRRAEQHPEISVPLPALVMSLATIPMGTAPSGCYPLIKMISTDIDFTRLAVDQDADFEESGHPGM